MRRTLLLVALLAVVGAVLPSADAGHSTPSRYHWAGSGDRPVAVLDSVTTGWDAALTSAVTDWSAADVIDLLVSASKTTKKFRKKCPLGVNAIRVCNGNYGATGWAGLANVTFDSSDHILRARARLNTYYVKSAHDMQAVACHEIGHTLGLGHRLQSETTSCLTPVLSAGDSPDAHDIAELEALHTHVDLRGPDPGGPTRTVTIELPA